MKGLKVEAVDTTGAGDAFVAGILSQLAVDLSLLQVSKIYLLLMSSIPKVYITQLQKLMYGTSHCLIY